ncbi:hybrid sensor histidine kinase/response regulator [Thiothrix lacustris]|uniref:hybrid sensor histidine kinase/response regulator n=1 Tax=Thiothrix lacustris TaxID=525917 RepID=UPI00048D0327|nr:hybrid sensor histidine kinase/response regulator [Thiothrix lacustris]
MLKLWYLLLVGLWVLSAPVQAGQPPLILPFDAGQIAVTPQVALLEDATHQLDLTSVMAAADAFRVVDGKSVANLGRTRSAWWLHFTVTNPSGEPWYLLMDTLLGDEFALYLFPDGADSRQMTEASAAQYAEPLQGFPRRAWQVNLPPDQTFQVYLRVTNGDSILRLPVEFLSANAMLDRSNERYWLLSGLYVALLLLATYQALMFVSLRESSYLFLAIHILAMFATLHRTNPLFPALAFLSDTGSYFFTAPVFIAIAAFLLFSRQILDLPRHYPRLSRLYLWGVGITVALMVVAGGVPGGTIIPSWLGLGLYLLEIPVSLLLASRGNKIALYFGVVHVMALITQSWNWWHLALNVQGWDPSQDLYMGLIGLQLIFPVTWLQALRMRFQREQLQKMQAEHKAKDEFLAVMSHELRTPLHAIVGLTGLLRLDSSRGKQEEYVERLHSAAQHQLHLVGNILDMAKAASQTMQVDNQPFRLMLVLQALNGLITPLARQKGLELLVQVNGVAEGVTLLGDRLRLTQVLMNLLNNAVKYTRYGYITLEVTVQTLASGGYRIHFAVADTGIGIPFEKLAYLFEPFSQMTGQAVLQQGGVGLGLAISKRLVMAMGGELSVNSQLGEGSTFAFELVFKAAPLLVVEDVAVTRHTLPPGLRVLLVDDAELNRFVGAEMLHNMGVSDVMLAPDGESAILQLQQRDFDVILLDISMPGMDGFAVTRWLRRHGNNPHMPVIALSAHALDQVKQEGEAVGMDAFLPKPFEYSDLETVIQQVLSARRRC